MKTYSEFHDGFFEGIRTDKDGKVTHVYLSTDRNVRTTAVLNGVVKLKAEGFEEGNIIFDVSTRQSGEITLADIAELYNLDSTHEPKSWENELMDKIRDQHLQILEVNPSYGDQCLILAQTIEFRPGEDL
jgi:hypothetical protein